MPKVRKPSVGQRVWASISSFQTPTGELEIEGTVESVLSMMFTIVTDEGQQLFVFYSDNWKEVTNGNQTTETR